MLESWNDISNKNNDVISVMDSFYHEAYWTSLTSKDIRVIVHKVDVLQIPFCIVVKLLMRQLQNVHVRKTWGILRVHNKDMSPRDTEWTDGWTGMFADLHEVCSGRHVSGHVPRQHRVKGGPRWIVRGWNVHKSNITQCGVCCTGICCKALVAADTS